MFRATDPYSLIRGSHRQAESRPALPFAGVRASVDVQNRTGGEGSVGEEQHGVDDFFDLTPPRDRMEPFEGPMGFRLAWEYRSQATTSAPESLQLFTNRYEGDVDNYLRVFTAQTIALADERNDIDIQRREP